MNPLISGWDFNVAPYMSELEFQFDFTNKRYMYLRKTLASRKKRRTILRNLLLKYERSIFPDSI